MNTREMMIAYGTDDGPHAVETHGNVDEYPTFAKALAAYEKAALWAKGFRALRNVTTGEMLDCDTPGWRRENWTNARFEAFGLDRRYHA